MLLDQAIWKIICDFDCTITPFDITDAILERFASPAWGELEQEWIAGKISARECMSRQVRLITADRERLDAFLDSVPLTPGFSEFITACQALDLDILVLSDGLDYAIRRILTEHGLGFVPVIANRLCFHDRYACSLEFPYGSFGCSSGVCKCEVARALGGKILLIGDGRSDCCLAGKADLVLAREGKELLARCRSENYPHLAWKDFFDVRAVLEEALTAAPVAPVAQAADSAA